MQSRWPISALVAVVLSTQLFDEADAQGLTTYVESSGTGLKPRSNAGLAVQTDRVRMRADLAVRAQRLAPESRGLTPGGSTEVVPNLRSAVTIAKHLNLETRVNFAEWNARSNTTFDTRLNYRRSFDVFFDELDGTLWRSADGSTTQRLRLGFKQFLGGFGGISPLTLIGQAIAETTQGAATTGPTSDRRKLGVEMTLAGFASTSSSAGHALVFKVEKTSGVQPARANAVTYDQSWTVGPMTKLGVNFRLQRSSYSSADDFEPSVDFRWRSQF